MPRKYAKPKNAKVNPLRDTKFQLWFHAMDHKAKEAFAKRCNTSTNNIVVNWMRRDKKIHVGHRKFFRSTNTQPKSHTMLLLAKQTKGACTYDDMLDHFYRL